MAWLEVSSFSRSGFFKTESCFVRDSSLRSEWLAIRWWVWSERGRHSRPRSLPFFFSSTIVISTEGRNPKQSASSFKWSWLFPFFSTCFRRSFHKDNVQKNWKLFCQRFLPSVGMTGHKMVVMEWAWAAQPPTLPIRLLFKDDDRHFDWREKSNKQVSFQQIQIKMLISFHKLLIKLFAENILAVVRFSKFVKAFKNIFIMTQTHRTLALQSVKKSSSIP